MTVIDDFGKAFVPKNIRPGLREYLLRAGIIHEPYGFFGIVFFTAIFITSFIYIFIIYGYLEIYNPALFFLGTFASFTIITLLLISLFMLLIYFYLDLIIYQRTNAIEQILPDYLQLVSTNIKSGMSVERSMWAAIKPRFGVLAIEMEIILKKVMTGHDLGDALETFSDKYNSPMLKRTMNLIVGELESGGRISHILDNLVANLKNAQKMKAEMAASVITYMIFIGAIVIVISPALFALSYHLLLFLSSFIARLAESGSINSSVFSFKKDSIDVDAFRQFSFTAVLTVSILSSMIVSIIERGDIRAGLKYIPIFVLGSLFCYFIFSVILDSVFGNIIL